MSDAHVFLTKQQTLFYKGLAIFFILLHNFFHLVKPVTYQNELDFFMNRIYLFIHDFSLNESVNAIFSFFGHYGVPVFIFLSGYGLTKSFQKSLQRPFFFIIRHIGKIYFLFLLSAVLYIALYMDKINYKSLFYALLLCNNFHADTIFRLVGPWWFFSLIIQLYVLFIPLFYWLKNNKINYFFIFGIYILSFLLFFTFSNQPNILFFANFPAHIPEFSLGILIALYEGEFNFLFIRKNIFIFFLLALAFLILAQFYFICYLFSFIASVVFIFSFCKFLNWQRNCFFEFSGKISPYLFGVNGFLFRHHFVLLANQTDSAILKICYALVWLLLLYTITYWLSVFIKNLNLHKPLQ